jgi:hypothetical protein
MTSKITPAVLEFIEGHDPHSYVRVGCKLQEPILRHEERQALEKEMHCTHLMQTAFLCSIEVPIKHLNRLGEFESIREIFKAQVF